MMYAQRDMPLGGAIDMARDWIEQPWGRVQAGAEGLAREHGLALVPAARFGVAVARHVAAGRPVADVEALLDDLQTVETFSAAVDDAVEAASLGQRNIALPAGAVTLWTSFFEAMPCKADLRETGDGVRVTVSFDGASRPRPDRVAVPRHLWTRLRAGERASAPYGARLMLLD